MKIVMFLVSTFHQALAFIWGAQIGLRRLVQPHIGRSGAGRRSEAGATHRTEAVHAFDDGRILLRDGGPHHRQVPQQLGPTSLASLRYPVAVHLVDPSIEDWTGQLSE